MTYTPHALLVLGGVFAQTRSAGGAPNISVEEWSISMRLRPQVALSDIDAQQNLLEGNLPGLFSDMGLNFIEQPYIGAGVVATYAKVNVISGDGTYALAERSGRFDFTSSTSSEWFVGANTTRTPDLSRALKVTWRTDRLRGPASRGGFYLPGFAMEVGANGRLDTATQTAVASAVAAGVTAINTRLASSGVGWKVAVVSKVGTPGPAEDVTRVECGSVPDHIARRRNDLPEAYVGVDLA